MSSCVVGDHPARSRLHTLGDRPDRMERALAHEIDEPVIDLQDAVLTAEDARSTEPLDLWSSRLPEQWADEVPQQRTISGITDGHIERVPWTSTGRCRTADSPHLRSPSSQCCVRWR